MSRNPMLPRPTVCHVLHNFSVGGAELLAATLGRNLCDEFRVVFACLDEAGALAEDLRAEGFLVHVVGRSPGVDIGCARRLRQFLDEQQVRLIHAHQYAAFFYSVFPGWRSRRRPVLFTEHGRHFPDVPSRKRMLYNRICLGRRDRVSAVGDSVRRALIANEGIAPTKITVIYNGVDVSPFVDARGRRFEVRQSLGVEQSDKVIVQVARLDRLKDHITAIRTMARLRAHCPDAKLILVGEGPERAKIEAEIARHQLAEWVTLLGYRADIPELLAASDIMLLTSLSEGIPVTLIEGMAAGLPVVATDVGGVGEVVEEGVSGYLAAAGDDAALAQALRNLIGDPESRRRMGCCGIARAESVFSQRKMVTAYLDFYRQMIAA